MGPVIKPTQEDFIADNLAKNPDSEYFTEEGLESYLDELENNNIDGVLFYAWEEEEKKNIIKFVKKYKQKKTKE